MASSAGLAPIAASGGGAAGLAAEAGRGAARHLSQGDTTTTTANEDGSTSSTVIGPTGDVISVSIVSAPAPALASLANAALYGENGQHLDQAGRPAALSITA